MLVKNEFKKQLLLLNSLKLNAIFIPANSTGCVDCRIKLLHCRLPYGNFNSVDTLKKLLLVR